MGMTGTIKTPVVSMLFADCITAFVPMSVSGVAWAMANGNKQPRTTRALFNDFRISPHIPAVPLRAETALDQGPVCEHANYHKLIQ